MDYINIAYVVSAVCFIFGIKMLSHPKTARRGNAIATLGMFVAIAATLYAGKVWVGVAPRKLFQTQSEEPYLVK